MINIVLFLLYEESVNYTLHSIYKTDKLISLLVLDT